MIRQHAEAANTISASAPESVLRASAKQAWKHIVATESTAGFRNAQFTLLAAAGVGGLILDCDASDLGPMISLVEYSCATRGKTERKVNPCVEQSLTTLGYTAAARGAILVHILDMDTIEGAPGLKLKDVPVFDCQFPLCHGGSRVLAVEAQMKMIATVQPSLSGCTQRPLILPATVTIEQLAVLIKNAWSLGIRTLDIYRSSGGR